MRRTALLRAQQGAQDVDLERAADALGGQRLDPALEPEDAAVVDQPADRTERVWGGEQRQHVVLAGDISPNGVGPHAERAARGGDVLRGLLPRRPGQADVPAGPREP